VVEQTPTEHDQIVAAISHVPHLTASALAAATPPRALPFAAAGWQDTTRVAAGDVELWRQLVAANRHNVLASLDAFIQALVACREALQRGDDTTLVKWLQAGKRNRDAVGN
jgi:prephenate dehydrogenase